MNLLLLHPDDFTDTATVKIIGRRVEHLAKTLKVKPGQELDVGLVNGKIGSGKITAIDKKSASLSVEFTINPPAPTPITLLLALPRPLMLKRILQTVTAMGIKEIHLINSSRVEKSYWGSSDLAEQVIYQQLILGLEQSRDTILPKVFLHKKFNRFIGHDIANIVGNKQALIAELGPYPPCPANIEQATVLAVGPEGGFIADEVAQFINAGFRAVQIGERPLRVEAAVTALLGRLLPL